MNVATPNIPTPIRAVSTTRPPAMANRSAASGYSLQRRPLRTSVRIVSKTPLFLSLLEELRRSFTISRVATVWRAESLGGRPLVWRLFECDPPGDRRLRS